MLYGGILFKVSVLADKVHGNETKIMEHNDSSIWSYSSGQFPIINMVTIR